MQSAAEATVPSATVYIWKEREMKLEREQKCKNVTRFPPGQQQGWEQTPEFLSATSAK